MTSSESHSKLEVESRLEPASNIDSELCVWKYYTMPLLPLKVNLIGCLEIMETTAVRQPEMVWQQ